MLNTVEACGIEGRIGIVFAHQPEQPGLLLELIGDCNRFDHRRNDIDRIVLEGNDPLRAGTKANSATAASGDVELRSTLLVFIQRTERALLGAPLALGTALQCEVGIGRIFPARMHCHPARGEFHALDSFECSAHTVLCASVGVVRSAQTARRVDPGPPGFIRKTDEVRVRKTVF